MENNVEITQQQKRGLRKQLQLAVNEELNRIICAKDMEHGLEKLRVWLADPKLKMLQELVGETTNKSFLLSAKIQPHFHKMLAMRENNENSQNRYQPYLECFIERFAAVNEKIEWELNAPIHYAVKSLNIGFLEWLLKQDGINVNIRNNKGKTALYLLCEQMSENPVKQEDIRQCITLLLNHKADFNICSSRLELSFELLMMNKSEGNEQFLQKCAQIFGDGIVIGKTNSQDNRRTIGFYQDRKPKNETDELLEIYKKFEEEGSTWMQENATKPTEVEIIPLKDSNQTKLEQLKTTLNKELKLIISERDTEIGLAKLRAWLTDPRLKILQGMIKDMKKLDKSTGVSDRKSFLWSANIQPRFYKMLENKNIFRCQPYLECFITHFEAVNEKIEWELNAPIHYAAKSHNIPFLKWLLKQPDINVDIRNIQGKTALFLLCEQMSENPDKQENIRQCITLLLRHRANFNICSSRLELPFELLMMNKSEGNEEFLQECADIFGDGIVIGKTNSLNMRTIGYYQDKQPQYMTKELLEIYKKFEEEEQKHQIEVIVKTE